MAHVSQTITPTPTITLFGDVPNQENNFLPRARVRYQGNSTVTAKGAGDTKTLDLDVVLPQNYAYAINQVFIRIGSFGNSDSSNYDDLGLGLVQSEVPGTSLANIQLSSPGNTIVDDDGSVKIWTLIPNFCDLIYNQLGNTPQLTFTLNDTDGVNASAQMSCVFWMTFLQYDIRQVDKVRVNAPMPVRSC